MISPALTAALCIVGGVGLMALVIAEGMALPYHDDDHEQVGMVAATATVLPARRDQARRGVTVWELRRREHADSMAYYPSPLRRTDRP